MNVAIDMLPVNFKKVAPLRMFWIETALNIPLGKRCIACHWDTNLMLKLRTISPLVLRKNNVQLLIIKGLITI